MRAHPRGLVHDPSTILQVESQSEPLVVAFVGTPRARRLPWNGEPGCKVTLRISIDIFAFHECAMRIVEGDAMWLRRVLMAGETYGLGRWLFEMGPLGHPSDLKTTYPILPYQKIDMAMREQIERAALHSKARLAS